MCNLLSKLFRLHPIYVVSVENFATYILYRDRKKWAQYGLESVDLLSSNTRCSGIFLKIDRCHYIREAMVLYKGKICIASYSNAL